MLNSVRSEIMDPRNRNQVKCDIPQEEVSALKELIRLQKERVITIKATDKGAAIVFFFILKDTQNLVLTIFCPLYQVKTRRGRPP